MDFIKEKCKLVLDEYPVNYCILFGSYAKGKAGESSDVDLLIDAGRRMTFITISGLRQDVCESLMSTVPVV